MSSYEIYMTYIVERLNSLIEMASYVHLLAK
jgi:hypothetical protein